MPHKNFFHYLCCRLRRGHIALSKEETKHSASAVVTLKSHTHEEAVQHHAAASRPALGGSVLNLRNRKEQTIHNPKKESSLRAPGTRKHGPSLQLQRRLVQLAALQARGTRDKGGHTSPPPLLASQMNSTGWLHCWDSKGAQLILVKYNI